MRDRIKRKLHSLRAFTLAETLLAVLILLLVTIIVAAGIPVAKNAYERVVLSSNADLLLSTTISTLRNELGTAENVKLQAPAPGENAKPDTMITYYNATRGSSSRIYVNSGEKQEIMLQRYYSKDVDRYASSSPAASLISSKRATADLYVTYKSVTFENGIITFSELSVDRVSGTRGLASRETLSIRVISK